MYDDNNASGGNEPLPDLNMPESSGSGVKGWMHKIFSKSETIIPILLIVLFLLFLAINYLGTDPNAIPVIGPLIAGMVGNNMHQVLVIGEPIPENIDMVYNPKNPYFKQRYRFQIRSPDNLERNPSMINQYDFIILDQTASDRKDLPITLAEEIKKYVNKGGNLMIVGNSGIRLKGTPGALGWVATLGDSIAPADCSTNELDVSPCQEPIPIRGKLENNFYTKVLNGVDKIPATAKDGDALDWTTYAVASNNAKEWMSLVDTQMGGKTYPGILYKSAGFLGAKIVYFNYDQIWQTQIVLKDIFYFLE